MCDHKYRLTTKDKGFLVRGGIKPWDCHECEAQVRMRPKEPKLRLEEEEKPDHDDSEAQ